MKIIVLHGEDVKKSYDRLTKFIDVAKTRSWEITYFDESKLSLREILSQVSLFGKERFFVLRDYLKLTKNEIIWLNKQSQLQGNLIIYHEGTLPLAFLKILPKDIKTEEFKLAKIIWTFLDNLHPGNTGKVIRELHEVVKTEAPEFVFSIMAKHFRDLYWVKTDASTIPYQSWRISKLKSQSLKFNEVLLKEIIDNLSQIDINIKTSKADLLSALDLLIIKKLK